ncbi:transcription elongation factor 1 homolog [Panicum virgatum]|uniref:Transcription elongation factor 1 homolog n=1 Tax=Panicum virgatum TaxID=38727 RepID=A0A8T0TCJ4_PANVG|nr:transcription elongation factor 1 homolog [Panicum virgatum]KAG2609512.1 hypothetical protein PVAP13_4KG046800 [Panicum virgatum]
MAKRKSRKAKAPPKKKPAKLDTAFVCPFCGHPDAVGCLIDQHIFARASCRICQESYATSANALTEPVDVYSEWIDACEIANEGVDARPPRRRRSYDDDDDF